MDTLKQAENDGLGRTRLPVELLGKIKSGELDGEQARVRARIILFNLGLRRDVKPAALEAYRRRLQRALEGMKG